MNSTISSLTSGRYGSKSSSSTRSAAQKCDPIYSLFIITSLPTTGDGYGTNSSSIAHTGSEQFFPSIPLMNSMSSSLIAGEYGSNSPPTTSSASQQSEHTGLLFTPTLLPTIADEHYYWNSLSTASTIVRQPSLPSSSIIPASPSTGDGFYSNLYSTTHSVGPRCDQTGLLLTPTSLLTTAHEYGSNSSSTPQTAVQQSYASTNTPNVGSHPSTDAHSSDHDFM
jgi:hypothetical protein